MGGLDRMRRRRRVRRRHHDKRRMQHMPGEELFVVLFAGRVHRVQLQYDDTVWIQLPGRVSPFAPLLQLIVRHLCGRRRQSDNLHAQLRHLVFELRIRLWGRLSRLATLVQLLMRHLRGRRQLRDLRNQRRQFHGLRGSVS